MQSSELLMAFFDRVLLRFTRYLILFVCCVGNKKVKETRRKLHAHCVMSLPVAD
jgi:hypothetical protein